MKNFREKGQWAYTETSQNFRVSMTTPTLPFLQNFFKGLLFGWTLLLFWPNLKFVALPVQEIKAIVVLGGMRTPNLGEGEVVGCRGWYRSKERR